MREGPEHVSVEDKVGGVMYCTPHPPLVLIAGLARHWGTRECHVADRGVGRGGGRRYRLGCVYYSGGRYIRYGTVSVRDGRERAGGVTLCHVMSLCLTLMLMEGFCFKMLFYQGSWVR